MAVNRYLNERGSLGPDPRDDSFDYCFNYFQEFNERGERDRLVHM